MLFESDRGEYTDKNTSEMGFEPTTLRLEV